MTIISHTYTARQTDWEQKILGEKCVIQSRNRTAYIHNHLEKIKTADDIEPLIIFSFDMDNTLIYHPKTVGEKEEDLEKNVMYEKIHASFLAEELLKSLQKFIASHITMLPILVTSSTLDRVNNILYDTESTSNFLEDIFTPDQIFARGTFDAENPLYDITKQNLDYSDKFIKKLQERKLIATQDNIHIFHFGDHEKYDKAFIENLNQHSKENPSSIKMTGKFFRVNLKDELCDVISRKASEKSEKNDETEEQTPLNALSTLLDTDKEIAEDSIATHIIVEIEDIYEESKEKFRTLKNNKRSSEEPTSSSYKQMKTDHIQNIL